MLAASVERSTLLAVVSCHVRDPLTANQCILYLAAMACGLCCVVQNADYTPELTGLLSQQATWQMMQLKPQLDVMLRDAPTAAQQG